MGTAAPFNCCGILIISSERKSAQKLVKLDALPERWLKNMGKSALEPDNQPFPRNCSKTLFFPHFRTLDEDKCTLWFFIRTNRIQLLDAPGFGRYVFFALLYNY